MKINRLFIALMLLSTICFSQHRSIYIGYPNHIPNLEINDRIILDRLPWHPNGFLDVNKDIYFKDMINFMQDNSSFRYNIYLYSSGSSSMSLSWTQFQSRGVQKYLFSLDSLFYKNFIDSIIPMGNTHPLFNNPLLLDSINSLFLKESIIIELKERTNQ